MTVLAFIGHVVVIVIALNLLLLAAIFARDALLHPKTCDCRNCARVPTFGAKR